MNSWGRWLAAATLAFCAWVPAAGAETAANASVEEATHAFSDMKASGTLHTTYSFRNFGGRDDHDIYTYFSLRLDDVVKDKLDGAFSAFWHEDLDGSTRLRGDERFDPFLDIDQSSGTRLRIYTGYIDVKDVLIDDSVLRLGRQFLDMIDFAHFDGASYRFEPFDKLEATLFGGQPVRFHTSTSGDAIYGVNLDYRFSQRTRAALRYYRYDERRLQDDLAAIEVWHRFTPWLQSHAEFSLLNGQPYMLKIDHWARVQAWDLDIIAQGLRLFESLGDHTLNFNPFFPLLHSFEPFTYGSLYFIKGFGDFVSLTGGVDLRRTDSIRDPVTRFTNRDYVRGLAGVEIHPTEQVTLAVNAEFWDVDPNDEFVGVSGEIEYRPSNQWRLTAGAEYGRYVQEFRDEFLFFFGEENVFRITPDSITYYARVRWQPTRQVFTSAAFEYEDNSFDQDDWMSVRLQMGVSF